jgi:isochorismate synthase
MTTRVAPGRRPLLVRSIRLDSDLDLAEVAGDGGILWEQGGVGFAGRGVAARIPVLPGRLAETAAAVAEVLGPAAVQADGDGPGSLAFGALPFRPDLPGELVVPEVLVRREQDGRGWLTVTGSRGRDAPVLTREAGRGRRHPDEFKAADSRRLAPDQFVVAGSPHSRWIALVGRALDAIAEGRLAKVVLAREATVTANRPLRSSEIGRRLLAAFPGCRVFAAPGFVGASPELLVARFGDRVRARPLAGTAAAGEADLRSSRKDRHEHRVVVDAVVKALAPWCTHLSAPPSPDVVTVGGLAHLATPIEGVLRQPAPSVLRLVAALHPTPAVAGSPRDEALAFIDAEEGIGRGRYAGPVGWVDASGAGEWAIAIRSAELDGPRARLFAGAGIVARSDPAAELRETQLKLEPLLNAIVRP